MSEDGDVSKGYTKREFLKLLGLATVGGIAGYAGKRLWIDGKENDNSEQLKTQQIDAVKPRIEKFENGVSLVLDREDLPIQFRLQDGTTIDLDRQKMLVSRELALKNEGMEIADLFRIPILQTDDSFIPSVEYPKTERLSDDVISKDELERRKVYVVNAPNVKFHIRRRAFEENGLLHFYNGEQHNGIYIVLIDGPDIVDEFLNVGEHAHIKQYSGERMKRRIDVEGFKRQEIEGAKQIAESEDHKDKIDWKLRTRILEDLDADEWKTKAYSSGSNKSRRLGVHEVPELFDGINSVVYVSVSDVPMIGYGYVAFDKNGKAVAGIDSYRLTNSVETYPHLEDSHQNPNNINEDRTLSNTGYVYEIDNPSHLLRHELFHDVEFQNNYQGDFNLSEAMTDMRAIDSIKVAWKRWEESGHKDDSGYYFIYETDSGFVLV